MTGLPAGAQIPDNDVSALLAHLVVHLHATGTHLASTSLDVPGAARSVILADLDELQHTVEECESALQQGLSRILGQASAAQQDSATVADHFPRLSRTPAVAERGRSAPTPLRSIPVTPSIGGHSAPSQPMPVPAHLYSAGRQTDTTPQRPSTSGHDASTPPSLPVSPAIRGTSAAQVAASASDTLCGGACTRGVKEYLSRFVDWQPQCPADRSRELPPPFVLEDDNEEEATVRTVSPTPCGAPRARPSVREVVDDMVLRQLQYDGIALAPHAEAQLSSGCGSRRGGDSGPPTPVPRESVERLEGPEHTRLYQEIRRGVLSPRPSDVKGAAIVDNEDEDGEFVGRLVAHHFPNVSLWIANILEDAHTEPPTTSPESGGACNHISSPDPGLALDEEGGGTGSAHREQEQNAPMSFASRQVSYADDDDSSDSPEGQLAAVTRSVLEQLVSAPGSPSYDRREDRDSAVRGGRSQADESLWAAMRTVVDGDDDVAVKYSNPDDTSSVEYEEATTGSRHTEECRSDVSRLIQTSSGRLLADLAVLCVLQELTYIVARHHEAVSSANNSNPYMAVSALKEATQLVHAFQQDRKYFDKCTTAGRTVDSDNEDHSSSTSPSSVMPSLTRLAGDASLLLSFESVLAALGYLPLVTAAADPIVEQAAQQFVLSVAPFLTLWGSKGPGPYVTEGPRPASGVYRTTTAPSRTGNSNAMPALPISLQVSPVVWQETVCSSLLHQVYHINQLLYLKHRLASKGAGASETLGEWKDRMVRLDTNTGGAGAWQPRYPESGLSRWVYPLSECILTDLDVWEDSHLLPAAPPTHPSPTAVRGSRAVSSSSPHAVGYHRAPSRLDDAFSLPPANPRPLSSTEESPREPVTPRVVYARPSVRPSRVITATAPPLPTPQSAPQGNWPPHLDFIMRRIAPLSPPPPPPSAANTTPVEVGGSNTSNAVMLELPHAQSILAERDTRLRRSGNGDFFRPARPHRDTDRCVPATYFSAGPSLTCSPTDGEFLSWQPSFRATMCYCLVSRYRCLDPLVSGALLHEVEGQGQLRVAPASRHMPIRLAREDSAPMSRVQLVVPPAQSQHDDMVSRSSALAFAVASLGSSGGSATSSSLLTRNLLEPPQLDRSARMNPPDLLVCGHVLSHKELERLSVMQQRASSRQRRTVGMPGVAQASVRCPYCTRETKLSEVLTLSYIY